MMLARILPPLVAKEVRALLPVWLGALAVLVGLSELGRYIGAGAGNIQAQGLLLYGAASVTLGALSMGHEYSNRTLPLLLSQPSSRAHVFVVKQLVLALMLTVLALVAWIYVSVPTSGMVVMTVELVGLSGLFVTPWLTMLTRNPLAGAVFTGPMAGLIWLLVEVTVARPMQLVVFTWAALGLCALAAVLGWRTCMRLEEIGEHGSGVRWPSTRTANATPSRDRHPVWLLAKKEMGLQQLSLAIAAFYVAGWLALTAARLIDPRAASSHSADVFGGMTVLYSGMLALLIGSLASAEERQLGTLEWQGLLPIASWKQWTTKVAAVLTLSMLVTVALPMLLLSIWGRAIRINEFYATAMLLLTTVGLYVSSLNSSGVRALMVSLPLSLVVLSAGATFLLGLRWRLTPLPLALFAAFVAVALYFALLNHHSSERRAGRIGLQVFVMAGCLAFATAVATLAR